MTVEPSSVEFVTNIFQVRSLLYKSNKCLHKHQAASSSSFGLFLWPVILTPYWFLFLTQWPMSKHSEYRKSFLMRSLNKKIVVILLTWTHFTVNVERLRKVWLDDIYPTICLSFVKPFTAVYRQLWKTVRIFRKDIQTSQKIGIHLFLRHLTRYYHLSLHWMSFLSGM